MRVTRFVALFTIALCPAVAAPWPARGGCGARRDDRLSSLAPRGWDLYLLDVESHRSRRLTDHPALDFNAAFAPEATGSPSSRSATATPSCTRSAPTAQTCGG